MISAALGGAGPAMGYGGGYTPPRVVCGRCNATERTGCQCPDYVASRLSAAEQKRARKNAARRGAAK
jgi:hypothetical protein